MFQQIKPSLSSYIANIFWEPHDYKTAASLQPKAILERPLKFRIQDWKVAYEPYKRKMLQWPLFNIALEDELLAKCEYYIPTILVALCLFLSNLYQSYPTLTPQELFTANMRNTCPTE